MAKATKIVLWFLIGLGLIVALLVVIIWRITFHPAQIQTEVASCPDNTPILQPGQSLKVLTYNVQYMAGKNYIFFYDLSDNSGPDERPAAADIAATVAEVARVIQAERPDIILLQEVDDGAARTDYEDQLARLLGLLPSDYACHTSAFYWQAGFVPHPRIMGAVGHKLSIISKYRLQDPLRYQLPLAPADPLTRQFSYKRAILETRLPVEGGPDVVVLTTHLEVSSQGAAVKKQEITALEARLTALQEAGDLWLLGGDFNLLPPGQVNHLPPEQGQYFRAETELAPLFETYHVVPDLTDITADPQAWFTMLPNDPSITEPDRTLDYIFFSDRLILRRKYVRQRDTLAISDHLPLLVEFQLP